MFYPGSVLCIMFAVVSWSVFMSPHLEAVESTFPFVSVGIVMNLLDQVHSIIFALIN